MSETVMVDDGAVLRALVEDVPFDGWTTTAVRRALERLGRDPGEASLLFPGGAPDMIEAWSTLADCDMAAAAAEAGLESMRLPARVRAIILIRLAQNEPHREAIRRALAILALPANVALATRLTMRTVDEIWHAAGDRSADFSWYTKRAILAGVYSSTLLYWLRDHSEDFADTVGFLDRRLAGVALIGKTRKRIETRVGSLRPGRRFSSKDPSPSA